MVTCPFRSVLWIDQLQRSAKKYCWWMAHRLMCKWFYMNDHIYMYAHTSWWTGVWPCIITAMWRCRKTLSQWEPSFHWKLRCHWLRGLRKREIPLVIQGPGLSISSYQIIERKSFGSQNTSGISIFVMYPRSRWLKLEFGTMLTEHVTLVASTGNIILGRNLYRWLSAGQQ